MADVFSVSSATAYYCECQASFGLANGLYRKIEKKNWMRKICSIEKIFRFY